MGWGAGAMAITLSCAAPAAATSVWDRAMEAALQCVPFAREVSGVGIYGDAWTWWGQAEGRYERGRVPRVGAVMAFTPHGGMKLGHVAVVRRLVSPREVRLDHSNWSLINGRRGQIERDVRAVDVSPGNDWSAVRVWFGPIAALGGTAWPVTGFIYPAGGDARARIASSEVAETTARRRWRAAHPAFDPAPVPSATAGVALAAVTAPRPARRSGALGRLLAWRTRGAAADAKLLARSDVATRGSASARPAVAARSPTRSDPPARLAVASRSAAPPPAAASPLVRPTIALRSVASHASRPAPAPVVRPGAPEDLLALIGSRPARR